MLVTPPGLVVILENVRRDEQIALFEAGLAAISKVKSLVNKVVEIDLEGSVTFFELPEID